MGRRLTFLIILAALLAPSTWLFWQARQAPQLGAFQDDSLYLAAAKSLANGSGYRILSLPGQPWQTKYPPFYPALLSLIWKVSPHFPDNLTLAVVLQWLLWIIFLAIVGLFIYSLRPLTAVTKRVVLVFVCVAPAFVYLSLQIMPETLFASLILGTLLLVGSSCQPKPHIAFAAGLTASAAYLTKTSALPLLIAVPIALCWRRGYAAALSFTAPVAIAVLGWTAWSGSHREATSDLNLLYYTDYLGFYTHTVSISDLPNMAANNAFRFLRAAGRTFFFTAEDGQFLSLLLVAAGAFSILATISLLKRIDSPALWLFTGLYTCQLLCWNYLPNERFMLPLLPLIAAGMFSLVCDFQPRSRKAVYASGALVITIIGLSVAATASYIPAFLQGRQATRDRLAGTFRWIATSLPSDAQLVAYPDVDLYLFTDRRACRIVPLPRDYYRGERALAEARLLNLTTFARTHGTAHLLWDAADYTGDGILGDAATREALLKRNWDLTLEHLQGETRVYRMIR